MSEPTTNKATMPSDDDTPFPQPKTLRELACFTPEAVETIRDALAIALQGMDHIPGTSSFPAYSVAEQIREAIALLAPGEGKGGE